MSAPSKPSGEPATILIIDDTSSTRESLVTMVEGLGYRGVSAESGVEAVRLVREVRPSAVLLDVVMPQLDGFKVAAMIKAQPGFTPVILLSAIDDLESKRRGQLAGADDFLSKPVTAIELQIRLAAMLRIRALTDQLDEANRRLTTLAGTDWLTGLPNRRRFESLFAAEYARSRRYHRALTVLAIDVDHFKDVNDSYGHPVGDEVLRAVASTLRHTLRASDFAGRLGGEEFAVLAPEVKPSEAHLLGERLRGLVEALEIPTTAGGLHVTISIGAAAWSGEQPIPSDALFKAADDALYQAKGSGRNKVVVVAL